MVDVAMDILMSIADIGWWNGSLSVALVNVAVAAIAEEFYNSSVLLWKMGSSHKGV